MPVTLPVLFDSKQVANNSSIRALIIDECYTTICFTVEKSRAVAYYLDALLLQLWPMCFDNLAHCECPIWLFRVPE